MAGKTFVEMSNKEQAAYVKKYKEIFKSEEKPGYISISRALNPEHYKRQPIKPKCEVIFKIDGTIPFEALYYGFISTIETTSEDTKIKKDNLRKIDEQWYASETDPRWGEIQQKKAAQQEQASRLLQALGISIKAINQSMADRIETKKLIDIIKSSENEKDPEKQKEATRVLKSLWLDHVDIKKGRSGLYQMANDLHFYMLPDYFIKSETVKDILNDTTLSERYKNILTKKLTEFLEWKKYWKENIRLTEKIAIEQLTRDLAMVVLYKKQLRPILENIKRLEFMSGDPASVYSSINSEDAVEMLAGVPTKMTTIKLISDNECKPRIKKIGDINEDKLKKYWIFNVVGVEVTGANDWFFLIKASGYLLTFWECCLQQRSIEDVSLKKEIDDYIDGVAGKNDIKALEEVAELARDLGLDFKIPGEKSSEKPKSDEGGLRLLDRLFESKPAENKKEKKEKTPEDGLNARLQKCMSIHKNIKVQKTEYIAEQNRLQKQIDKIMSVFKKKFNLP